MAVIVYKDGKRELVDPLSLESVLKAGWSVKKEQKKKRTRKQKDQQK
jgi:hypothetical protein